MEWSKYNYLLDLDERKSLIYNSMNNLLVEVDPEDMIKLKELENNKTGIDVAADPDFYKPLIDSNILVKNNKDEFYSLKLSKHIARYSESYLSLVIAPTLHCNLNCTYCFEASRPAVYMDDETEDAIINFAKEKKPEHIRITWYGGEPLLGWKRMKNISKKLEDAKILFGASMVTNGYLLTQEKINQLYDLHISNIQITVDGLEDVHNKRRPHIKNSDSFSVIMANLDCLVHYMRKLNKDTKQLAVSIRVNLDKTNSDSYTDILNYLTDRFGNDLLIYPAYVHDLSVCSSTSACNLDRIEQAKFRLKQYIENGVVAGGFFPTPSTSECMARKVNSYLFDPKGLFYKCWNDIGNTDRAVGSLKDKKFGNLQLLTQYLTAADPFEDKDCRDCFHLPVCGGGCTYFALKNEFENSNFDICYVSKDHLKEFLEIHYDIKRGKPF